MKRHLLVAFIIFLYGCNYGPPTTTSGTNSPAQAPHSLANATPKTPAKGNVGSAQEVMDQIVQEEAVAFVRIDYGIEYWSLGRVVIDVFGSHMTVTIARKGASEATSLKSSNERLIEIADKSIALIEEFSNEPLGTLVPDESTLLLTVGSYKNNCRSVQISDSKLRDSKEGRQFLKLISKYEQLAKKPVAEK